VPPLDLNAYRAETEDFIGALDREYYLHFAGLKDDYAIEAVYDRHPDLFGREAVDGLREAGAPELLEFAVHGLIGRETRAEAAELARREAELEIEVSGERIPYREAPVRQANEPDPERRLALELARNAALTEHLEPLLLELTARGHALTRELGWPSMVALCAELSGIDLDALGRQARTFLDATAGDYRARVEPELQEQLGFGFERLRRADLPAFFRAPSLDRWFPVERLEDSLADTLAGIDIELRSQANVRLDTEARPKKSPRAFCAPVKVPDEVYLVIARIGGRDDYAALFHEAGHAEHFAHADRSLAAEHRYLGDNSVTECFAFTFEHLVQDPAWLQRVLAVEQSDRIVAHARASKVIFLRRYCAKLLYELELHDGRDSLEGMPARYAELLGDAVGVEWPEASWLADVDPFFYAARYLRAWALETHLRAALVERFGSTWFSDPGAGDLLRGLWRHGQRLSGDELLAELSGEPLDLAVLGAEL
jgi:hypothetical protein